MWADANVMAAMPNTSGANKEQKFHNSLPCPMLQSLANAYCSNAANIGEHKTWTQSEFCTWQNSAKGQELPKMYIYSAPAQKTTKHRANFG